MIIKLENINFNYKTSSFEISALKNINLEIKKGEFVAIIGSNSSGKSTLVKMLNALLLPDSGKVIIDGLDTSILSNLWQIRQKAGMVFQNPENQIVGSTVEEDIAFGLENFGIELPEMKKRIENALKLVHMEELRLFSPLELSGGQMQRLAIAGILALQPEIIILDEPTSLLDPQSAIEILNLIHKINKQNNITIIWVTQNMEEIVDADRILIMNEGTLFINSNFEKIFSKEGIETLHSLNLGLPSLVELSYRLMNNKFPLKEFFARENEMAEAIECIVKSG